MNAEYLAFLMLTFHNLWNMFLQTSALDWVIFQMLCNQAWLVVRAHVMMLFS